MSSQGKNFVIFGATGKQGSAAVQWLTKSGTDNIIYAITRDPSSAKAQSLATLPHVQVIQGDSSDPEKAFAQVNGTVDGVFFAPVGFDAKDQIKEGKQMIDLAGKSGVGYLVFSSTDFSGHREDVTGIEAIEAKKVIEDYLISSFVKYTILRPVGFLENLFFPGYADAIPHFWPRQLIKSGIASSDIGRAVSEVLLNPAYFEGKIIGLSGYEGSPQDWMHVWEKVTGEDLRKREKKMNSEMSEEKMKMLKFIMFNENDARVERTRAFFPWVMDLQTFLEDAKARKPM
ncbi:hypothetical protein V865_004954 [Kwoniella europaea PYCC6329]|uniref:NmrA-like domain-containing protein n=1 Tax=Kwoniella europaea PYCC6329 TaxID=1423913 RepID=A0AAX4KK97_9TREE